MRFLILGPLKVDAGGADLRVTGRRERAMLAVLLVRRSHPVPYDRLVEALWEGDPPATARRQVHNCLWSLRRQLAVAADGKPSIVSTGSGHRLDVQPGQLDVDAFTERVDRARRLAAEDLLADAVVELRAGLGLWRGPALAGLPGPLLRSAAAALDEQRVAATELCLDLELRLGRHREVVAELTELMRDHPLRESLASRLMVALHRSGRTADALGVYGALRARMAEELGLDPGRPVRQVYSDILRDSRAAMPEQAAAAAPAVRVPASHAPAQLPAAVAGFVGRGTYLERLDALVAGQPSQGGVAVPVAVISGGAGVGKSALVTHWAHRVRGTFPDGQLFVNLNGFAAEPPVRPIDALAQFLRALGCPPDQVPTEVDEAADRYRSLLGDRRVLVVLDNAASADQVRPLLPGGSGCLVLITSRNRLAGLAALDGAHRVHLDVLTEAEALALLEHQLDNRRLAAEPVEVAELVRLCAGLPLALRIVAANLADRPWDRIAAQVAELRTGDRLSALEVGQDEPLAVRKAFDLSFRRLTEAGQRMFRLFGVSIGADLSVAAAAALAGIHPPRAAELLDELVDAHLVRQHAPGRYAVHDLLRWYAAERVAAEETGQDRAAAVERLVSWYEDGADAAAQRLYPLRLRLPRDPDPVGTAPPRPRPVRLGDTDEAAAWLRAEHANLVRVVTYTAERGPKAVAWRLADTLRAYFWLCMNTVDWLTVGRAAVAAAEAEGSAQARSAAWFNLGDALRRLGRNRQAPQHYERALTLAEEVDWTAMMAAALGCLGGIYRSTGQSGLAEHYLLRALSLAERVGAPRSEAVILGGLGAGYREVGRLDEGVASFSSALRLFRECGSREGELAALAGLGTVWHAKGDLAQAADHLTRAIAGLRDIGDRSGESDALPALAAVERDRGRLAAAAELAGEALVLAEDLGDRRAEAAARTVRATINHHAGRSRDALAEYHRVLDLAGDLGEPYLEVEANVGLAEVHIALEARSLASVHARQALSSCRVSGYRLLEQRAAAVLAGLGSGDDPGSPPLPNGLSSRRRARTP